jgi:uncharacterized membrane protein YeaQ/YmgE (transglycosylase-associated protein family)
MLGEEGRGGRGLAVTAIISAVAAAVFGSTAWGQFATMPEGRVFATVVFALVGAAVVWVLYGVIRLVSVLVRGGRAR